MPPLTYHQPLLRTDSMTLNIAKMADLDLQDKRVLILSLIHI